MHYRSDSVADVQTVETFVMLEYAQIRHNASYGAELNNRLRISMHMNNRKQFGEAQTLSPAQKHKL